MAAMVEVRTLGKCAVDGVSVASRRAVEFCALVALSGGRAHRDQVTASLFETGPAPSSLPTLALRARKAGIPISYERSRSYRLAEGVRFDVVELLDFLRAGRVEAALDIYSGPFLPVSHSFFATNTRGHVEAELVRQAMNLGDVELMTRVARAVKHPELSEALVNLGADPATESLSRSWLSSLGMVG